MKSGTVFRNTLVGLDAIAVSSVTFADGTMPIANISTPSFFSEVATGAEGEPLSVAPSVKRTINFGTNNRGELLIMLTATISASPIAVEPPPPRIFKKLRKKLIISFLSEIRTELSEDREKALVSNETEPTRVLFGPMFSRSRTSTVASFSLVNSVLSIVSVSSKINIRSSFF